MIRTPPTVLEALRLPALCRKVCRYAGMPLVPGTGSSGRFVVRSGAESPELLTHLLEEALLEDGAEAVVFRPGEPFDPAAVGAGEVAARAGFDDPCPDAERLRRAASPEAGPVLLFAVERRDEAGNLLGVTWAAVPEEEPPPRERLQAAVARYDYAPGFAVIRRKNLGERAGPG
jgi:hypothetical protein